MALRIGQPPPPPEEPIEESIEPVEEAPVEVPTDASSVGGGQVDPTAARYFGPESRCEGCIHYLDAPEGAGACEIVAGPIDPQGICSLFVADIEPAVIDQPPATSDLPDIEAM